MLDRLKMELEEESYADGLGVDMKTLEKKIADKKANELLEHKDAIVNLIEKDIVSRFHYQKGRIEMGLRNDIEIKEAVAILNNPAKIW